MLVRKSLCIQEHCLLYCTVVWCCVVLCGMVLCCVVCDGVLSPHNVPVDLPLSVPVDILLEQCLHRPIFERCKEVRAVCVCLLWASTSNGDCLYVRIACPQATSALVAVLKDDHSLMQHFSNIQVKLNEQLLIAQHVHVLLYIGEQTIFCYPVWCLPYFLSTSS